MNLPKTVRGDYEKWRAFLREQVTFSLKDSEKHTKDHCARVLLYALLIGEAAMDVLESGVLLYRIFKDADGLDRYRLGPNALDVDRLRTAEARSLTGLARHLVRKAEE